MIEPAQASLCPNWSTFMPVTCSLRRWTGHPTWSDGSSRSMHARTRVGDVVHCVRSPDPGIEDLLCEVDKALPDETTSASVGEARPRLFEEINAHLASRGYRLRTGTMHHRRAVCIDEEGQAVVFRDEGHRGGRRVGSGAQLDDDGGQRKRRDAGGSAAAWRDDGVGRRRLPGSGEAEHRDGGVEWPMKPGRRRCWARASPKRRPRSSVGAEG